MNSAILKRAKWYKLQNEETRADNRNRSILKVFIAVLFILIPILLRAQQAKEYISPDGQLKAVIITFNEKNSVNKGVNVEIKEKSEKVIINKQYKSSKKELKIVKAAWTPDSQYFIFSRSNSIASQKYFPIDYYDRSIVRFRNLHLYATDPNFEVMSPDIIKIYRIQANGPKNFENKFVEIKLSALKKPSYELVDEQLYNNYTARTFFNSEDDQGYIEILRDEKMVFKQNGYRFRIGLVYKNDELKEMGDLGEKINNDLIAMGKDITGNGIPNLVVNEWSGGAHCCYHFYVFEIGQQVRKIATLDARHSDGAHFEDIRGDKKLSFITNDWTFTYWNTGFAGSPAPKIILSFKNDAYTLDSDLMRKPSPTQKELEEKIKKIRGNELWADKQPPVELWSYMLDLIYSGNAKVAWLFFDKAWDPAVPGKKEFLRDFELQLKESAYWQQIKKMQNK